MHAISAESSGLRQTMPNGADVLRFLRNAGEFAFLDPALKFAATLPPLSGNILELHLNSQQMQIDLAPRINAGFDRGIFTNGSLNFPFLSEDLTVLMKSPVLRRYAGIENIWIEYDSPFAARPALFFDIDRKRGFNPESAFEKMQWLAEYLSFELRGNQLSFLDNIANQGLAVLYYGFMFSRNTNNARMTIKGIRADQLDVVLKSFGWKGSYKQLGFLQKNVLNNQQSLVLGVDISDNIEPRIGLEVVDDNPVSLGELLIAEGLPLQQSAELLQRWPKTWMPDIAIKRQLSDICKRSVDAVHTRFNHFKFILDDSDQILTKAYLYYCF